MGGRGKNIKNNILEHFSRYTHTNHSLGEKHELGIMKDQIMLCKLVTKTSGEEINPKFLLTTQIQKYVKKWQIKLANG